MGDLKALPIFSNSSEKKSEDRTFDMARWIELESLDPEGVNHEIKLPYGLQVDEIIRAMTEVRDLLHEINVFLVGRGNIERLEDILLGNTFSGVVSELLVQAVARSSTAVVANQWVGGHPDLLPASHYSDKARVLHADEGIEIKTSRQSGSWQGHNPEKSWVMVFQYAVDTTTEPSEEREPFRFEKAMIALLEEDDWSFSGRTGTSRRTPTASILKSGTAKLHASYAYQRPGYTRSRRKPSSK